MANTTPITLVKIGGSTLGRDDTSLTDVVRLAASGMKVVVVHGGGPLITSWTTRMGVEPRFINGLRVTDATSLEVAIAVLCGLVNKQLVSQLTFLGGNAIGLSGADATLVRGTITNPDLGYVAGSVEVEVHLIHQLLDSGYLPVIAPLAIDPVHQHQLLNVNADTIAGSMATALGSQNLIFLTDVDGILDTDGSLILEINRTHAPALIDQGVVSSGMIPKLNACVEAVKSGSHAYITNGTKAGAILGCLDGTIIGTRVV
jgi:acetylglutamate kinase